MFALVRMFVMRRMSQSIFDFFTDFRKLPCVVPFFRFPKVGSHNVPQLKELVDCMLAEDSSFGLFARPVLQQASCEQADESALTAFIRVMSVVGSERARPLHVLAIALSVRGERWVRCAECGSICHVSACVRISSAFVVGCDVNIRAKHEFATVVN